MTRLSSLVEIERLYRVHGASNYGEGLSQVEHAVQCASLAEAKGGPPSLVLAALLHDIGHLFQAEAHVTGAAIDQRHEAIGAQALAGLFGQEVRAPIALHVSAKRWLCFRESDYRDALSPASRRSLELQGGPFDAAGAEAFERERFWREAVELRRFDDAGKRDDVASRPFAEFVPLMRSLRLPG
jgi:phosphonate degradation associated HDIG domain protein